MACSESDFAFLRDLVFQHSRNVLDPRRDYLFETRLNRLMQKRQLAGLDDLVRTLRQRPSPQLQRDIAEAMTINETSFFRDIRPFELMQYELLPALLEARAATRTLRFWSAASSSGQEAYSLAILLREYFPQTAGWQINIFGNDLSAEMVERAKRGRYSRIEINRGLPARLLIRYFDRVDDEWEVKPEIRAMCAFRQMNLSPPLAMRPDTFDGVLLRNVMLYFSQQTRRDLLTAVHRMLAPDGFLLLGSSEQPANPERWQPVLSRGTCHYRPRRPS